MKRKPQKLVLWDAEALNTAHVVLDAQPLDGDTELIIRPHHESTNDKQRGYYRGVMLLELSNYTGFTQDEMHEFLKKKFGDTSLIEIHGETYEVSTFTTSNLGQVAAMSAFIDKVLRWAAGDLGLAIQPPDPAWSKRARKAA